MSGLRRAVLAAVLLAIAIAVVAWATGPQGGPIPPTAVPIRAGALPDYTPICGATECAVP